MRLRAALLFVLTVLGLVVVVLPTEPALACSCAGDRAEQDRAAELIVIGTVTDVRETGIVFAVESVEKGEVERGTPLRLRVGRSEASCGYEFRQDGRYRVNARAGATGLCTGVVDLPPAPRTVATGAPPATPVATPVGGDAPGRPWWVAGAALVLLAVAALAWRWAASRRR